MQPRAVVMVIVGGGAMGTAAVRRGGSGCHVVLGDVNADAMHSQADGLRSDGFEVTTRQTDVSDAASVSALAELAASLGPVQAVVHTAGVSPVQASAERVLNVDLVGVAHMLEAFGSVVSAGSAAVVIASMAGHLGPPLTPDDEAALRSAAPHQLFELSAVRDAANGDPGLAYAFAKRAVSILVAAASVPWGRRGARVNAISPGVIATPMGRAELDSANGEFMRMLVDASGTGRYGTPDDIAAVAEFLLSPAASFVTGTDLLVDGGAVAALRSGYLAAP
jgi:NAD(P)-dependent dehydrogenase (short-subunit alcohol dehydrogenase family)